MSVVTLTTDFGKRDPYVAAMKGVLCCECPGVQMVDLSHDIAPQDVLEGALFLAGAAPYFPPATIHVAVVDPGVGTGRAPIVVSAGGQRFVCPDNGLLSLFARQHPVEEARVVSNPVFMRHPVSATFHGRDIFAPTAGRLACGAPLEEVGDLLGEIVLLDVPCPERESERRLQGTVIHVDRFGNAITNIPHSLLADVAIEAVRAGDHCIEGLYATYGDVAPGRPLALIGSSGYLEIAVRDGNAGAELELSPGTCVTVNTLPRNESPSVSP